VSGIVLIKTQVSNQIRVKHIPQVVLKLNGASYLNKKAASLLDLKPGDTLVFYHTPDFKSWYIANDGVNGVTVNKSGSLYKFCDTKRIRQIFEAYGIVGKKAFFPTEDRLQESNGIKSLYIIPKPFNVG
jgi:hypothetical protein